MQDNPPQVPIKTFIRQATDSQLLDAYEAEQSPPALVHAVESELRRRNPRAYDAWMQSAEAPRRFFIPVPVAPAPPDPRNTEAAPPPPLEPAPGAFGRETADAPGRPVPAEDPALGLQREFGLSDPQTRDVRHYAQTKGWPYVAEKADVVRAGIASGKIDAPGAAFVVALEKDWRPSPPKPPRSKPKAPAKPREPSAPEGWREAWLELARGPYAETLARKGRPAEQWTWDELCHAGLKGDVEEVLKTWRQEQKGVLKAWIQEQKAPGASPQPAPTVGGHTLLKMQLDAEKRESGRLRERLDALLSATRQAVQTGSVAGLGDALKAAEASLAHKSPTLITQLTPQEKNLVVELLRGRDPLDPQDKLRLLRRLMPGAPDKEMDLDAQRKPARKGPTAAEYEQHLWDRANLRYPHETRTEATQRKLEAKIDRLVNQFREDEAAGLDPLLMADFLRPTADKYLQTILNAERHNLGEAATPEQRAQYRRGAHAAAQEYLQHLIRDHHPEPDLAPRAPAAAPLRPVFDPEPDRKPTPTRAHKR
jgi:hypothetical protein